MALLLEYYDELPQFSSGGKRSYPTTAKQAALETFKERVRSRYTEGTLQRLIDSSHARTRRAAVLALGLVGSMESNARVARRLRDDDRGVRQLAVESLWAIWFRGDTEVHNRQLQHLRGVPDPKKALLGLSNLIKKAPRFAEAFNQRAILYFQLDHYAEAIADCESALKWNRYHFGALAGMGQCFIKLHKPRAALKAFRSALEIHPGLEGIEETIHSLEDALGGEGKKDDKK